MVHGRDAHATRPDDFTIDPGTDAPRSYLAWPREAPGLRLGSAPIFGLALGFSPAPQSPYIRVLSGLVGVFHRLHKHVPKKIPRLQWNTCKGNGQLGLTDGRT